MQEYMECRLFFEILLLTAFALLNRLLVVKHAPTDFDTYGHLYFAKEVKEQKAGPFGAIVTKVIGSKGFRQPFLWHWIVGLLPGSFDKILQYQKWLNPIIDAVFAILIYCIVLWAEFGRQIAMYMALLYLLTPMWFSRLSTGPRIRSLTPRLSSELATNLFFIVTVIPLGMPLLVAILCGACLSFFVIVSSKFGLQAILFLVPLTCLITWDPLSLIAACSGFFIAIILTKGKFFETTQEQLQHLIWYYRKNRKREMFISTRNSFARIRSLKKPGESWYRNLGRQALVAIARNSYISILIKMPILPVVIFVLIFSLVDIRFSVPIFISGPVIAAVILFIFINMPPLLFLGEAERYLNHVAFFIVSVGVISLGAIGQTWLLWIFMAYGFLYWFCETFLLHRFYREYNKRDIIDDRIVSHLKKEVNPLIILSYPYHAVGAFRIMLETPHRVVFPFTIGKESGALFELNYGSEYPYVRLENINQMANELGVNFLIARKKDLASRGFQAWEPPSDWVKLDLGEHIYDIYQKGGS